MRRRAYGRADAKIVKVVWVCVIVLLFLLSLFVGIKLQLDCFIMSENLAISKTADRVYDSPLDVGSFTEDMDLIIMKAPVGSGSYVSVFDDKEVWVVEEMSMLESIGLTTVFFVLDMGTYMYALWVIYRYLRKHRVSVISLVVYELVYLFMSGVVYEYSNSVLYGVSGVGFVFLLVRMTLMIITILKSRKS